MTTQTPSIMAGQSATAIVDEAAEAAYWRENYLKRTYIEPDRPYSDYEPAFQHGWESRARANGQPFRDLEGGLERGWEAAKGESTVSWTQARCQRRVASGRAPRAVRARGRRRLGGQVTIG